MGDGISTVTIHVKDNKFILLDKSDYEKVTNFEPYYKWSINNHGYAYKYYKVDGKYKTMLMHRLIMDLPKNLQIDHINGKRYDNRKNNLRVCTNKENCRNRTKVSEKNKYKGVYFKEGKWRVKITKDQKNYWIGTFTNEIAAANCYNHHAKKLFGEFAKLNDCLIMEYEEWNKYKHSNSSEYYGVCKHNYYEKWITYINIDKKSIHIGIYDSEIQAAKAYNKKAIETYGETYSKLNIIDE